jgi:cell division protease FtsH
MMGGRAAEELVLNSQTTGAGNDIERATEIARKMVCEWGMSEKLGPLTFGQKEEQIFLGREFAQHRDYSEETARLIDNEVRTIVTQSYERAKDILQRNMVILNQLANLLLEKEVLDGHQIDSIVKGEMI